MKSLFAALVISTALLTPSLASAKTISATITMKNYSGPPAYIAVYLAKPNGQFYSTLSVRGYRSKYRRHLRGWVRGASNSNQPLDGLSGASVGSGGTFTVNADVKDALLNAGYKINVETAVENYGEFRSDVTVPINSASPKVASRGRGFVNSIQVQIK